MWYIALVCNFTEFHLPKLWLYQSWQEFHGVWSCFQNCQKGYFHFGTDFTDIVFRRVKKMGCIARRARTSRTLTFEASTKNWAISLSSRISRSLILLPKFSEGVCLFRQGLHGHCFLKPPPKNGLYRSRRGFHGVWSCFQNFPKGCVRFGTDFTDIGFLSKNKQSVVYCRLQMFISQSILNQFESNFGFYIS